MLWEGNADVSSAGVEEVLHSYGQGDYFGELALLSTKGALHSPETRSQHVSLRMLGASVLSWSFGGGAGLRGATITATGGHSADPKATHCLRLSKADFHRLVPIGSAAVQTHCRCLVCFHRRS